MYGPITQYFSLLQSKLNFSVKWVHVDDKGFGTYDETQNTWNGIIEMLRRGIIDTSILPLSVSERRRSVVDFTTPIYHHKRRLFMQRPQPLVPWDNFIIVFDVSYWAILWISFVVFSLCIFCMVANTASEVDEGFVKNNRPMKMLQALSSTAKAFATLDVSELMGNNNNRVISRRILTLVLCICGMLNFYVYNAGLISSLTVKRYDLPVNSLDDILNNPEYKLLVRERSFSEDFLRYDNKYHKLWKKSRKENGFISGPIDG